MACLARSRAALRLFGHDLRPDEITALLGAPPTSSHLRGAENEHARKPRVWPTGGWILAADDRQPANPDGQIAQILDQLTDDIAVWRSLTERFKVDMFCGWFMDECNEGVSLSANTLRSLGDRGIFLDVDIYGWEGESPTGASD